MGDDSDDDILVVHKERNENGIHEETIRIQEWLSLEHYIINKKNALKEI